MSEAPTARLCRCERPLRTDETCLLCGRTVPGPVDVEPEPEGRSRERSAWTRAGVARAIRSFAFFRGRPPSPAEWKYVDAREGWPSLSSIESLFGSFAAALSAAGMGGQPEAHGESATHPQDPVGRAAA